EFKQGVKEFSKLMSSVVAVTVTGLKQLLCGGIEGAVAALFGADKAGQILNVFNAIRSFIQDTLLPFLTTHGPQIKSVLIAIGAGLAAFVIIGTVVGWITGLI